MNTTIRSPLSRRLILYIVLCSSAITLFLTVFQLYRDYQSDIKTIDANFEQIKNVHLKTIELTVWNSDKDKLQTLLDGISNLPDIDYVSVDEGDAVISVGEITNDNIVSRSYKLTYQHMSKIIDIGVLKVVANLDPVYSRIVDRAVVILLSTAIEIILVAGFMLLIFHFVVTRHLVHIADFVSKAPLADRVFAPLKLDRREPDDRKADEFDQVVRSINDRVNRVVRAFSEAQEAEEARRQSEERYRSLSELSPVGVYKTDADGNCVYVNDRWQKFAGMTEEQARGEGWKEAVHPDDRERVFKEWYRSIERKEMFLSEYRFLSPDGHITWLYGQSSPTTDTDGNITGYIGTVTDITERKNAEVLGTRFGRIIEQSLNEIYIFDAQTLCFTQVNHGARNNLGYTMAELQELTPLDLKPEFTHQTFEEHIKPLRDGTEQQISFETVHRRKDGSTYDVEVYLQLMKTETPALFVAIIQDITERKLAEEALNESRQTLRNVIDAVPAMVNAKDLQSRYIFMNRYQADLYGILQEDAVGMTASELMGPDYGEFTEAIDAEVLTTNTAKESYEEILVDLNDNSRDLLTTKVPLKDETGAASQVVTVSIDITMRKQAERQLQAVAESVSSGVGKELFENMLRSLVQLLEIDYAFIGEFVDEEKSRIRTIVFFAEGEKAENFEYDLAGTPCEKVINKTTCIHNHGVQKKFPEDEDLKKLGIESYLGIPLFDSEREPLGIIVGWLKKPLDKPETVSNLLQIFATRAAAELERQRGEGSLHRALVEAEMANQAKSEFLATMSHEFRTPLNAILGFSDILSHQYLGPPGEGKYREYAEDIHASGEHLLELVNDILDISTIEAGKQSLVKEKLSTDEIVQECAKSIAEKARSQGIELVIKVPENLPPLYADRRALKQILFNLLSNSVKFTVEGGMITVSAKASSRVTTLKVADTGRGIPVEKLPELTNPFTRGEQDPHIAVDGWGLGLSITNSLVDLHDGKLDIKSMVGKGTTVTVTLPNGAL